MMAPAGVELEMLVSEPDALTTRLVIVNRVAPKKLPSLFDFILQKPLPLRCYVVTSLRRYVVTSLRRYVVTSFIKINLTNCVRVSEQADKRSS